LPADLSHAIKSRAHPGHCTNEEMAIARFSYDLLSSAQAEGLAL